MTHKRIHAKAGGYIKVNSNIPLIVMVRNDRQYQQFLSEGGANFYGGFFNHFPALIQVPSTGYWNVTVRWWGFSPKEIDYSVEIFQEPAEHENSLST
jgi:hypothetical protein